VDVQTGRLTRWNPDSPAAAWYLLIFFTKRSVSFHPAGGDVQYQTQDRVMHISALAVSRSSLISRPSWSKSPPRNSCHSHALRGAAYFGLVTDPDVSFACGSKVCLYSFAQKNSQREFFCAKEWDLPPCRRQIGPFIQADAWFGTDRVSPVVCGANTRSGMSYRMQATTGNVPFDTTMEQFLQHSTIIVVP
jgi:hypothetical protein